MTTYYRRNGTQHSDGTHVFAQPDDVRSEREVQEILERVWRCDLRRFGALSPIDWFACRDERVVALVELKTRSHNVGKYSSVFLNLRKWTALMLASNGFGVPPLFVVRFTDSIKYVDVRAVTGSNVRIAGCAKRVKSRSDIEPVIDVPVSLLKTVA